MRKRKVKKKAKISFIIFLLIIICLGIIVYINKDDLKSVEEKPLKDTPKKTPKTEEKVKIIDLESNSRPYAVMINNIKTVWGYQSGLEDAYLVYEIIVEGGYTRLMAIFKDKDLDRIGSVRSSRHYFLDYALENDAIYVHFGWSPQAESDIASLGINNINFMNYNGYTRDNSLGLPYEHTAFTNTNSIMSGVDYYGYSKTTNSKPLLDYSAKSINMESLPEAIKANTVNIVFSASRTTSFAYDEQNKVYKRYQNDISHNDYVTGNQYTAKNIITYKINNYTISGDDKGRQTIENIGSGEGWYISEGYAVPITWEKSSRSSKTIYKYKDGTKIKVNDGNTYIEIQPYEQNLTIE